MKLRMALLADFRNTKTVYIAETSAAHAPNRTSTHLHRMVVTHPVSKVVSLVMVVVKGLSLPEPLVEQLVCDFVNQQAASSGPYYREIEEREIKLHQDSRSKMNSTFRTSPPRAI